MKSTPFWCASPPRYSVRLRSILMQVERLFLFLHQLRVEPRGVGNVADQPVEPAHVVVDHVKQLVALLFAS